MVERAVLSVGAWAVHLRQVMAWDPTFLPAVGLLLWKARLLSRKSLVKLLSNAPLATPPFGRKLP